MWNIFYLTNLIAQVTEHTSRADNILDSQSEFGSDVKLKLVGSLAPF